MKKSNNNEVDIRVAIDGAEHKFVVKETVLRPCDDCSILEYCQRLTPDEMLCELLYGAPTSGNFEKVKDVEKETKYVVLDGIVYDVVDEKINFCNECHIQKHCEIAWHNSIGSVVCQALRDALTPDKVYCTLRKRKEG